MPEDLLLAAEKIRQCGGVLSFWEGLCLSCSHKSIPLDGRGPLSPKRLHILCPTRQRNRFFGALELRFIATPKARMPWERHQIPLAAESRERGRKDGLFLPVASPERALADLMCRPEFGPSMEELILWFRENMAVLNPDEALRQLRLTGNGAAVKRAGWLLEQAGAEHIITETFREDPGRGYSLLDPAGGNIGPFDSRWMLRINSRQAPFPEIPSPGTWEHLDSLPSPKRQADNERSYLPPERALRAIRGSGARVLLVKAHPGLGKGSLIRHFVREYAQGAVQIRCGRSHRHFPFLARLIYASLWSLAREGGAHDTAGLKNLENYLVRKESRAEAPSPERVAGLLLICLTQLADNQRLEYVIFENIDRIEPGSPEMEAFFSALLFPPELKTRIILSTSGAAPRVLARLSAAGEAGVIGSNLLRLSFSQKRKFLKHHAPGSEDELLEAFRTLGENPGAFIAANSSPPWGGAGPLAFIESSLMEALPMERALSLLRLMQAPVVSLELISAAAQDLAAMGFSTPPRAQDLDAPFLEPLFPGFFKVETWVRDVLYSEYSCREPELSEKILAHSAGLLLRSSRRAPAQFQQTLPALAMESAALARSGAEALAILRLHGEGLLMSGQLDTLSKWLDMLDAISGKPAEALSHGAFHRGRLLLARGDRNSALGWFEKAAALEEARPEQERDSSLMALALVAAGQILRNQSRSLAAQLYDRIIGISDQIGDTYASAVVCGSIGAFYEGEDDDPMALAFYNRALEKLQTIAMPAVEATVLNNIAILSQRLGQRAQAMKSFHQALAIYRTLDKPIPLSFTLYNLGSSALDSGQFGQAAMQLLESLDLRIRAGEPRLQAACLTRLAQLHLCTGCPVKAEALAERGLELALQSNQTEQILSSRVMLGLALCQAGRTTQAHDQLVLAGQLMDSLEGRRSDHLWSLAHLGLRLALIQDDSQAGIEWLEQLSRSMRGRSGPVIRLAQLRAAEATLKNRGWISGPWEQTAGEALEICHEHGLILESFPEFQAMAMVSEKSSILRSHRLAGPDGLMKIKETAPHRLFRESPGTPERQFRVMAPNLDLLLARDQLAPFRDSAGFFTILLDIPGKAVSCSGKQGLTLSGGGLSFRILKTLLQRPERPFSAGELYRSAWGEEPPGEEIRGTVQVAVSRLRRALGTSGRNRRSLIRSGKIGQEVAYGISKSAKYCIIFQEES